MNAEHQDFDYVTEVWGTPLSDLPNPHGLKKHKIIPYVKWGLVVVVGISAAIIAIKMSLKKQRAILSDNEALRKQLEDKGKELDKIKEQSKSSK